MNAPIKIGIAGGDAGLQHAAAFAQSDRFDVIACSDPSEEMKKQLSEAAGCSALYDSCETMLAEVQLDALVIASPTHQRERQLDLAYQQGIAALCESPPAMDARAMSRIATTAGLVGKPFMYSHPNRFAEDTRNLQDRIDREELGEIFHGRIHFSITRWPFADDAWQSSQESGGGAALALAPGLIDIPWALMGSPDACEVSAASYGAAKPSLRNPDTDRAERQASGFIRFKNGSSLSFAIMEGASVDQLQIELAGERGSARLNVAPPHETAPLELYIAQANAFADAIEREEENVNTLKQAQGLMKIIDAIKQSSKEKEAVSIKVERSLEDLFGGL